jgi:uncharacterized iron-regulated protein
VSVRLLLALGLLLSPRLLAADDATLNLPLGDAARRDREAALQLDAVTDTATGDALTPRELAARLKDVRLLFVGESHTSVEFHNAQRRVIEELAKSGRRVLIGLEMYPSGEQPWLDRWSAGGLSEDAFLKESRWYKNWGYHWLYYRDIFLFARDNKLRMFGVNVPREIVSTVNRKGLAGLSPDEKAQLPARIDTDDEQHRRLFRAFFGGDDALHGSGMSAEQWERMFAAQCTWDAAMGTNAVKALQQFGDGDAIMVVLIGSGHVAYGLGAERQARLSFAGKSASLIPIPVIDDQGKAPTVSAAYANFLWGVAREEHAPFPSLGLSTPEQKSGEYLSVILVQKGSAAEQAGFKVKDLLVSMDGVPLTDKETLNRLMSEKRWGDSAEFRVKRGDETLTLGAKLRRKPKPSGS